VFENREMRILGSIRDEVTGEWRRLDNGDLYTLYSSPIIIRVIKSTRMKRVGRVARMEKSRETCGVLVGKLEKWRCMEDPGVEERIILKCILKWKGRAWTGLIWHRRQVAGLL
jgi:hypothetical protein